MSAGGMEYTIYFAWVPADTAWDVSLARFDENIFDLVIEHDEGQIPTCTIEVKNPHIGFINPGRLYWTWISFSYEACGPIPLFFGRLIGIPEQIAENTVKMKFIARDSDYIYQKQQVARSLKVTPNYDPIFFEVLKRDDPDAILEGWSVLYHVDRVNGRVSASDVLVGEDGTINFAAQDVFYDSVQCKLLQSPLVAVNVKAEVQWEQQYRGYFYVGQWGWPTLGSDAFVGDWPKSGSNLGGGYTAGISWAGERDPDPFTAGMMTAKPGQPSYSFSYTNKEKHHRTGDTMSVNLSYTPPFGSVVELKRQIQTGLIDPFAVDQYGDPAPVNIPAKVTLDYFCYRTFALNFEGKQSVATIGLAYNADRKRSERLEMTVAADVQPILIDPLVVEDTEQITLKSGDLSLPFIDMLNWDSVAYGGAVGLGQFIFPDNPLVPGQTSSQICVQAGNTGMVIPTFSNIAGQTTADGSVLWASLGDTPPSDGAQDWVRLARVSLGTLLCPKPVSGVPDFNSVLIPGSLNYPPTGTAVPKYSIFSSGGGGPGDSMKECTKSGMVGGFAGGGPGFPPGVIRPPNIPGMPVPEAAAFHTFRNPSGAYLYICVQAGQTGEFHTTFNEGVGSQTGDGGVIWQNIGLANLPIGGWPGMTPAATYFPRDRGQISVQHMFCRARAKLRKRARAVEVSFDTRFEVAAQLSCRMNGRVSDVRLPGGSVAGKVISYKLEAHGDTGTLIGKVTLGCSTGKNNIGLLGRAAPDQQAITTDPGVPSYVNEGYVARGYQKYYSSVSGALPGTPPIQGVAWVPAVSSGGPGSAAPPPPAPPGTAYSGPMTPPNWPTLPPTLPPVGCPPLASTWSAGPDDFAGNQIGYSPPQSDPNDDGITFPASGGSLIMSSSWHGVASTLNKINLEIYNLQIAQVVHDAVAQAQSQHTGGISTPTSEVSVSYTIPVSPMYDIQIAVEQAILQKLLQGTGLWYELVLKPLTNGPFVNAYVVDTTNLLVPQTIDLSASSTGGLLSLGEQS
jgi:hypothetical protein